MPEYKTEEQKATRHYDKHKRDKGAKRFYASKAWRTVREIVLIRDNYLCQQCLKRNIIRTADAVHHIKELKDYPELALDESNLEGICNACHNKEHPEKGKGDKPNKVSGKLKVVKVSANKEDISL